MYIVTNTIQIKTPHADKMVQRFQSAHTMESMEGVSGFISVELMQRLLPEDDQVTELVVLSRWESEEDQRNWVDSSSFKGLHQKKPTGDTSQQQESPVLGNVVARFHAL